MNNSLFFLIIGCASICFTIIVICNGPVITQIVSFSGYQNCKYESDQYNEAKKGSLTDEMKKYYTKRINKCKRHNAMYGLEYASLITDIVLGFICTLLGLLSYFGTANGFGKIIGIIGLASGIICFILTLVYVCYSGYIFTKEPTTMGKLDKDGAYAEWKNGEYVCKFYDKDDEDAIYAKYSDLGKKQYNYNKDRYFLDSSSEIMQCRPPGGDNEENEALSFCLYNTFGVISQQTYDGGKPCNNLYTFQKCSSISNKYKYDKWVTSIIFSVLVIACNIGLALFGFLIFKDNGSSGHTPV